METQIYGGRVVTGYVEYIDLKITVFTDGDCMVAINGEVEICKTENLINSLQILQDVALRVQAENVKEDATEKLAGRQARQSDDPELSLGE